MTSITTSPVERIPLAVRFWRKVDKSAGPDGCWLWTGARSGDYGQIRVGRRKAKSSRVAWVLSHGPIPEGVGFHGTCVLHSCDNPLCVNPAHLHLGSQADNGRDASTRRRVLSKLSPEEVIEIRRLAGEGATWEALAKRYAVRIMTIY